MRELIVDAGIAAVRLDVFLARAVAGCSRRQGQSAIERGEVRVNGRRARKGQSVAGGDIVQVPDMLYEPPRLAPNPQLVIPILYEDAAVIAVDKPPGLPSHALRRTETETVANFLLARLPALAGVGNRPLEAGLVHRLDTDTSGVLLAARTTAAYNELRRQFAAHSVVKEYLALVHGDVAEAAGVEAFLAHDPRDRRRMRVAGEHEPHTRAWPAVTRYRPLERFGTHTLLSVEIATGVTHQIRVHLAGLGFPVVGDALYGEQPPAVEAPRQFLHAVALGFKHPESGQHMQICSPPHAEWDEFLDPFRATRRSGKQQTDRRPTTD